MRPGPPQKSRCMLGASQVTQICQRPVRYLGFLPMAALQHQSLATGADLWDESRSTAIALREQSLRLRALLQNGANESLYFRRRLPSYTMAVVSLTHFYRLP